MAGVPISDQAAARRRFFDEVVLKYDSDQGCLLWPFSTNADGYAEITIDGRHHMVHRLVCEIVHGPPPSPKHDAAHRCGRAGCVSKACVRWTTPKENEADKWLHGTKPVGERNKNARLTEDKVREIRSLNGQRPQKEIAQMFGVGSTTISAIFTRRTWAWLPDGDPKSP
jgi:hypothetical protein